MWPAMCPGLCPRMFRSCTPEYHAAVVAAEAERVRQHVAAVARSSPSSSTRAAISTSRRACSRCPAATRARGRQRDDRFGDARGAEQMAVRTLGSARRRARAEDVADRAALRDVVGARRRAVQVDVADRLRCAGPRAASARSIASRAPRPSGCGVDMWYASQLSPTPTSTAPSPSRSSSANPAPSPIEMPLRSGSNGRQGAPESSSSERKPYSVVRQRLSAPPTTAASAMPVAIIRAALAEHLRARRTGGRHHVRRPFQPERRANERRQRVGALRFGDSGNRPAVRREPGSRRWYARSVESTPEVLVPMMTAIAARRRSARARRAPLRRSRPPRGRAGEAVVAAVERRERLRQRHVLHAGDPADERVEHRVLEVAGSESGAPLAQARPPRDRRLGRGS